jgi:hypothetical protein
VRKTADYIIENFQASTGGFRINCGPEIEDARTTGDITRNLIKSGHEKKTVEKAVRWIIQHQRHDGGWLYKPLSGNIDILKFILFRRCGVKTDDENNSALKSCPDATLACGTALLEYRNKYHDASLNEAIKNAADFFLKDSMGLGTKNYRKDFTLTLYPVFSVYTVLGGLLFIARAGYADDPRTGRAFNLLLSKQNSGGAWDLESSQPGISSGIHRPDKWVTLNVMRLLKNMPPAGK